MKLSTRRAHALTRKLIHRRNKRQTAKAIHFEQLEDRRMLAVVPWSGDIPDGTIWRAGDVHHLTGDVRVPPNATLNIEPGAIVKFGAFHHDLLVQGTLNAVGTAGQNITFTELRDDIGGDTNGDGTASAPAPGNWRRIEIQSGGSATIQFARVRYGGFDSPAQILLSGGGLNLSNSTIASSTTSGLRIESSNPVLAANLFENNIQAAISMDLASNPNITGASPLATGNSVNGLLVDGGTYTSDAFWDDPDVVYVLAGDIAVEAGKKLTIAPGQAIKFRSFNNDLFVNGTLDARGTSSAPIIFTEFRDDSVGGDTNQDAANSNPGAGNWGRIELTGAGNQMSHVELRYGGFDSPAQLRLNGGQLGLSNSLIQKSITAGFRIESSDPAISDVRFIDNVAAAISMDLASNPAITGADLATGNSVNGVLLDSGTYTTDGFWNDPDIVYVSNGDITVAAGKKLTVGPGQVVKFRSFNHDLVVEGTLDARGAEGNSIVFTEFRDDSVGGDTNQDAAATAPAGGNWGRIELTGSGNQMSHVDLRHGGFDGLAQLHLKGGQLELSDSIIQKSSTAGLRIETSSPTITDVQFLDNIGAAVRMDLASDPSISAAGQVIATGNLVNGLLIDAGTMPGDSIWNDSDIVYVTGGDITVPEGHRLTIAPGQIIKFGVFHYDLIVHGTLDAQGSESQPIIFTEFRDDTAGGDTNKDGESSAPAAGNWGRIEATGPLNVLRHVHMRYGGFDSFAQLWVNGGDLDYADGIVQRSSSAGLRIDDSNPQIVDVQFLDNTGAAARMDLDSNPVILGGGPVIATGNAVNGLLVDAGSLSSDAFWDDPDIVYVTDGDITVPQNTKLTIAPGQIVKFGAFHYDLRVAGSLDAQGSEQAPIVITEFRDDTAGGDTNRDGQASSPSVGNWGRIELTGTGNLLSRLDLRYGGFDSTASLLVNSGELTFSDSTIQRSVSAGIRIESSSPTLDDVQFLNNVGAAARMDLRSNPLITASSGQVVATANGVNGLVVDAGELPLDGVWNDPAIVYALDGDITVPQARKLTIAPGQVIKLRAFHYDLLVDGILDAQGTASAPIVITEGRDDSAGGDTNNDQQQSLPAAGNWGRIALTGEQNTLKHVDVRFGGFDSRGMINVVGGTATISSSTLSRSSTGGLYIEEDADVTLTNSISAFHGASAAQTASGAKLTVTNSALDGSLRGATAIDAGTQLIISNSLVTNNVHTGLFASNGAVIESRFNDVFNPAASSGNYTGLADQTELNGNFSADPAYVSRENMRFDLLSRSPALDAADSNLAPATDALGQPRFDDPGVADLGTGAITYVDLGPFERQNVSDPLNLIVETATVSDDQVMIDDTVTINWTIRNNLFVAAAGTWTDAVFASSDNQWDREDTLVSLQSHSGGLAAGETYSGSATFKVPPKVQGQLHFIIRTDSQRALRESIESDNERVVSTELVIPELALDTPLTASFTAARPRQFFRLKPPANRTLILSLDSDASAGSTQFYVREGAVPTATNFQFGSAVPASADHEIQIPETDGRTVYVLAQAGVGAAATAEFDITATMPGFKLNRIQPAVGGNAGPVTIELEGTDLTRISQVTLIGPDNSVLAPTVTYFGDANHLYAQFDLVGTAPGKYDVRVFSEEPSVDFSDSGELIVNTHVAGDATLPDAFEVQASSTVADPVVDLVLPGAARFGTSFPFTVEISNQGLNDILSPVVLVNSPNGTPLSFTSAVTPTSPSQLQFVPLGQGGRPTVLRPGQSVRVTLYALANKEPSSQITANLKPSTAGAIDWASLESQYRDETPAAEWQATWTRFQQIVGDTFDELHHALRAVAEHLADAQFDQTFVPAEEILGILLEHARAGATDLSGFRPFSTGMDDPDPLGLLNGAASFTGPIGSSAEAETNPPAADDNRDTCRQWRPRSSIVLAAMEAWAETAVVAATTLRNGSYAASFFVEYLQSSAPKYEAYSESSDLVRGNAAHQGLKFSNTTLRVGDGLWQDAMDKLRRRMTPARWPSMPQNERIDIETMPDFLQIPLTDLFKPEQLDSALSPFSSRREGHNPDFYFADALHYGGDGDAFSIPSVLAGGVGKTDPDSEPRISTGSDQFGDDRRRFTGSIILRRVKGEDGKTFKVVAESLIRLFVKDTVDFCPGDLGEGLSVRGATVPLKSLEANGWAFDVGFEAEFSTMSKTEVITTKKIPTPPLFCPSPPQPGNGEGEGTSCDEEGELVPTIRSRDPNDITGPAGVGDHHSILLDTLLPYRVRFENDPEEATAPALDVVVTNQLDADMDWTTFEFGTIGFGSIAVEVPPGRSSYSTVVEAANPDGSALDVEVTAQLNPDTGLVTVSFRSLDPLTGLPPIDPFAGFLPPNDETHRGEGFFTYLVRPKPNLATGTRIENSASIVFDINDPILTNTAFNTVDIGPPSSQVLALPAASNTRFNLQWSGTDDAGLAGIGSYDIFVSDNDGAFQLFLDNTTATTAEFTGVDGHTYRFYSVATDLLGHTETAPTNPDTQTQVFANAWQNSLNSRDVNPDGSIVPLDVLNLINELNSRRFSDAVTGKLVTPRPAAATFFYDVNGDTFATPLDALNVINFLNQSGGEGETAGDCRNETIARQSLGDLLLAPDAIESLLEGEDVLQTTSKLGRKNTLAAREDSRVDTVYYRAVDELFQDDDWLQ